MIFDIFWCMNMHWCAMNKSPSGGFSPQILICLVAINICLQPSTTTFPSSGPWNEEPKYWTRALGKCVYCDSGMWFIQTHPTLARTTHDCLLISPPCFCVWREWYQSYIIVFVPLDWFKGMSYSNPLKKLENPWVSLRFFASIQWLVISPLIPPCFVDQKLPKNLALHLAAQGERLDVPHLSGRRGSWCFRFTPLPLGPALEVVGTGRAGASLI